MTILSQGKDNTMRQDSGGDANKFEKQLREPSPSAPSLSIDPDMLIEDRHGPESVAEAYAPGPAIVEHAIESTCTK